MIFDWDSEKSESNLKKHGVSFEQAILAFEDFYAIEEFDAEHSTADEKRYKMLALAEDRVLVVVYTMQNNLFRIISARKAEKYEQEFYDRQRSEDVRE